MPRLMTILTVFVLLSPITAFAEKKPKQVDCPAFCFNYCEKNATPGGRGKTNCQVSCQQQCVMSNAGMK